MWVVHMHVCAKRARVLYTRHVCMLWILLAGLCLASSHHITYPLTPPTPAHHLPPGSVEATSAACSSTHSVSSATLNASCFLLLAPFLLALLLLCAGFDTRSGCLPSCMRGCRWWVLEMCLWVVGTPQSSHLIRCVTCIQYITFVCICNLANQDPHLWCVMVRHGVECLHSIRNTHPWYVVGE